MLATELNKLGVQFLPKTGGQQMNLQQAINAKVKVLLIKSCGRLFYEK